LLSCAEPDKISFVGIQLQSIRRHPIAYVVKTCQNLRDGCVLVYGFTTDVSLQIVGIGMNLHTMTIRNLHDVSGIQRKQQGP
jgi:hypothetical protein